MLRWCRVIGGSVVLTLAGYGLCQVPPPAPRAHQQAESKALGPEAPTAAPRALEKTDVDAWLDGFFPYALQRGNVAGAVVVVVKDGQVLTQRGFGYADVATRKPVDPENTLFRPGSVSKLFTWTVAMQMVEQGKLNLDADINQYLDFKIPPRDGKPITLRNLMTHTPGFEEAIRDLISSGKAPKPLGDMLKQWTPHRIFAPGDVPAYSNYGAALAGYMVQRVSGEPFDEYVERHIFAPLNMTKASFRQPLPAKLVPFMASGYKTASSPAVPYEIVSLAPAGSLAASSADIAKFMIAHLNGGPPLLKPETEKLMQTPQANLLPRTDHMALGFYTQDQNGHRVVAHGGDTRVFHSNLWLFPNEGVGLFVSMNSVGRDGAVGPIRSQLIQQFGDRYFPGPQPAGAVPIDVARQHAKMMEGYYWTSRRPQMSFLRLTAMLGQERVVATRKGTIRLVPDHPIGGGQRDWQEIAPFLWKASDTGELLEARVVDGKIERFSSSPVSTYLPIPGWLSRAWLFPALQLAFAIVLLTALAWPVGAIGRRLYARPLALTGRPRLTFLLTRAAALLSVVAVLGWAYALLTGMDDYSLVNGGMDGLVLLLQVLTPLAFLALLVMALWNAQEVWTSPRGWFARLWSLLLLFAAIMAWWGAIAFHLIGFGHNY